MYETGVSDSNMEALADLCFNEGILSVFMFLFGSVFELIYIFLSVG